ncbi:MAG: hypothetical protein LBT39_02100 [Treponema sp.]|jgi:putative component of toxin-antitoxin plasmid stabilization module|nr:hypothetical protein [Treponema sp.]
MIKPQETEVYTKWLMDLRDSRAKAKIIVRVKRLIDGNPGDVRPAQQKDIEMAKHLAKEYENA